MPAFFLTDDKASQEEFLACIRDTAKAIAESCAQPAPDSGAGGQAFFPAYCGPEPAELRAQLAAIPVFPAEGKGFQAVLENIRTHVLPNLVRTASPGYLAHLHSPVLLESVAAELVIAAFNPSMDSWDQSPAATEIEVLVIRELCRLFGFGGTADGVFTSGGSQSNLTGILLARDAFCTQKLKFDVKKHGLPENSARFRMYASEVSHFSMEKSAHLLGLGYGAVRKVPADGRRKMDAGALRRMIREDLAQGNLPFCVAATAGTTDYGSIDPLDDVAEICAEYGLWMHTDAAYGSGLILSGAYRNRLRGIERADSVTVDFHKMFLQPISCSAVLLRDGSQFSPLELHADYLNREEDEEDGYINLVGKSMQTTRRFDALKVWASFQVRGKDGWDAILASCVENAAYVYERLQAAPDSFETIAPPEISSVVFRVRPKPGSVCSGEADTDRMNKSIRRTLLHKKGIITGQTTDNGRVFLKFTLLNPAITRNDLDRLLACILALRDGWQP
ncbi:MAG: aspartate aminotransferase family protein [Spirochaetes bacterium]|uniref:Aspartate aminotransferase family protein n=1 Tax=Candidatus Avitreponema avistercoris TaxID=2840705 RepID=A0A9D9HGV8_9SPIR|nr:aspartate aminotransferase family protein [Candidatus Avitreponema avistercoris]